MMHKIQYFTDRAFISELQSDLYNAMKIRGLIFPDQRRIQFCGFFAWKGGMAVFLPMNSEISTKPEESAYWLLKTFNRYYGESMSGVKDSAGELVGGGLLSLAIQLIDDYMSNGLYVRRSRVHTLNQGKINWSKTISRHTPFPSSSTPVYLDLESSRIRFSSDCEIAKIHAAVIRDINNNFGVFIHGGDRYQNNQLDAVPLPNDGRERWIFYLSKELSSSYSERDIFLIQALLKYVEMKNEGGERSLIIGTRYFHCVWESMLNHSLNGVANYNNKLAVPYYLMDGCYHEVADKGQRTDTILHEEGRYAVVDAKYYSAMTPRYAPGWPDIVKQLFYKKAVEDVEGGAVKVTTHFVFPGGNGNLLSAHVSARGQNKSRAIDNSFGYATIYCHYCDPILLMKKYVRYQSLASLRDEIFSVDDSVRD